MLCSDYFQPYINWLKQNNLPPDTVTAEQYIINIIGVANRPSQSSYYLQGTFRNFAGSQLTGWGTQHFNDKAPGNDPLNPNAPNKVDLTLTLPDGLLIMTQQSRENDSATYTLECRDHLLFGYCSDIVLIIGLKEGTRKI